MVWDFLAWVATGLCPGERYVHESFVPYACSPRDANRTNKPIHLALTAADHALHPLGSYFFFSEPKISPKNCLIASQDRVAACSLYALPVDLSVPACGWVKECTASP